MSTVGNTQRYILYLKWIPCEASLTWENSPLLATPRRAVLRCERCTRSTRLQRRAAASFSGMSLFVIPPAATTPASRFPTCSQPSPGRPRSRPPTGVLEERQKATRVSDPPHIDGKKTSETLTQAVSCQMPSRITG